MGQTATTNPSVEIVKQLFGDHPEDIVSPIKSAAEALSWLEELFKTIEQEALQERNGYRIKELAAMGAYLALDMGNYAGHVHETYIDRLQTAGVVGPEARHG